MGSFDKLFGKNKDVKLNLHQEQDMSRDSIYMVGINEDGYTQLKVGWPSSVTLTLNPEAVALLIKQLAVTIDTDYSVVVKAYDTGDTQE